MFHALNRKVLKVNGNWCTASAFLQIQTGVIESAIIKIWNSGEQGAGKDLAFHTYWLGFMRSPEVRSISFLAS